MSGLRITDAIDMHCHYGPEMVGRVSQLEGFSVTGFEAANEALASGHKAVVLKPHSFASSQVAYALEQAVPGLRVFGGICLDQAVGGLNVDAVDAALKLGGKLVWLPTIHSHQDYLNGGGELLGTIGEGIKVIGEDGRLNDAVREIFALVREHDAILATGHITAAEHYAIVKEFAREGKVHVTHAGEARSGPRLTPDQILELADLGAMIELAALSCDKLHDLQSMTPEAMANLIHTIGPERCTLSTDYGWTAELPNPAAGMQNFLESLWSLGISEADLTTMAAHNPANLLGL